MAVLYVVLPLALLVAAAAVAAFLWAVRRKQFDDLESPRHRILHDDEPAAGAPRRRAATGTARPRDPAR